MFGSLAGTVHVRHVWSLWIAENKHGGFSVACVFVPKTLRGFR